MSQPLTVIYTHKPHLFSELCQQFRGRTRIQLSAGLPEIEEMLSGNRIDVVLADFSGQFTSGHLEERLLDDLRRRQPGVNLLMILDKNSPETLERFAVCNQIPHIRTFDSGHIASLFDNWFPKGDAVSESSHAARPDSTENVSPADRNSDGAPIGSDRKPAVVATEQRDSIDARSSKGSASQDEPNDDPGAEVVLAGITRRYETNSVSVKQMLADLEVAAKHDVTILLIGETGSGKTFLSRLIHEVSPRKEEPFLHVACGALPDDLIESELFGHVKGAFTSAHADKQGKFLAAGRGTILLDEIDVLGAEQQVKLLKVIETGEFEPVGSNETICSQARLIVASNLELQPLVEQGKFRADLYYRLNMLKFEILPLRKRQVDIVPLARKFVKQMSSKHNVEIKEIDRGLFEALQQYPWPGNVRELENVIQRAVIYCRNGILTAQHLPPHILAGKIGPANDPSLRLAPATKPEPVGRLDKQVAMTEREVIEQALFKNNFSRTNTAKELGISRVTLYNKMKKYGMSK